MGVKKPVKINPIGISKEERILRAMHKQDWANRNPDIAQAQGEVGKIDTFQAEFARAGRTLERRDPELKKFVEKSLGQYSLKQDLKLALDGREPENDSGSYRLSKKDTAKKIEIMNAARKRVLEQRAKVEKIKRKIFGQEEKEKEKENMEKFIREAPRA